MSSPSTARASFGALLLLLLPACESDNVQWAFVSNPGGSFGPAGGAIVVIRTTSSSRLGLEGSFVRVDGYDDRGAVAVLLPHAGDFGVLSRGTSVEIRSPALAYTAEGRVRPGRFEADGAALDFPSTGGPAALRVRLPDCSIVHPGGAGSGTLHIATAGTLMVLESATGIVVLGERPEPEVLGLSVTLTTMPAGNAYALRLQDGRLRALAAPPPPRLEQRLEYVSARDSVRLLGPLGEVLAELPDQDVQLQNGTGGLFLQALLPQGLPGDPGAMRLLMAADNRYLLRIDE